VYLDTATSSSTWAVFRGSILIDLSEKNLPSIRQRELSRLVHSVLPFQIRFPKTVSASSDITVFSPVNLEAAIIRQFSIRTPEAETQAQSLIRLFTSIQYPFKLTLPSWGTRSRNDFNFNPTLEAADLLLANEDCLDNPTDPICEQEWKIVFDAWSPPVCDFTGDYTLEFVVRCEAGAEAHCPLQLDTTTGFKQASASVTFHITTEHFCPIVLADVDISASLHSFQDGGHTIPKTDFLQDATAYFRATVSSSVATIVETSISGITHTDNSQLFYSRPNNLVAGLNVVDFPRVGGVSVHPTESWFDIVLSSTLFPTPVDGQSSANLVVDLNVVFLNTEGRRVTQQLGMRVVANHPVILADATANHPVQASSDFSMIAKPSTGAPSTSSSSSISLAVIIGASVGAFALIAMGVAIFIYRRRAATKTVEVAMSGVSTAVSGATHL